MTELHHEVHLETYVVQKLLEQGWLLGSRFNSVCTVSTKA